MVVNVTSFVISWSATKGVGDMGFEANVISRLEKCKQIGAGKWKARCPAHPDKNPSLHVAIGRTGNLLLKCWAGCTSESILASLGLTWSACFPDRADPLKKKPDPFDDYVIAIAEADIARGKRLSDADKATYKQALARRVAA